MEDADATEKLREKASKNIRKVILPMLKFHATNYYHMIDRTLNWKQSPFLTSLSDEEVLQFLKNIWTFRNGRVMTEART